MRKILFSFLSVYSDVFLFLGSDPVNALEEPAPLPNTSLLHATVSYSFPFPFYSVFYKRFYPVSLSCVLQLA
jgi:hypothetical protein